MSNQAAASLPHSDLVYEWNRHNRPNASFPNDVELVDETLRDGLQSPSVSSPCMEDRMQLVRYMADLGIDLVNIGLPGAGGVHYKNSLSLASLIVGEDLNIRMSAAARTVVADIAPIVEISQKLGAQISVYTFIGTSPIRQTVENWSLQSIMQHIEEAIRFAVREGLDTVQVLEDTTRTPPEVLKEVFTCGIAAGASTICLCDTVGYADPDGIDALIGFTNAIIRKSGRKVKIDFHGHNDRGLATVNAIQAARSGAHRIHGCAVGIGERVGNCAMEQILVNLALDGHGSRNLSSLHAYAKLASEMTQYPIPVSAPVVGSDAFRTATGVHAAAIAKAEARADKWLADRVYSSVPASLIGRKQVIEIGNMSGKSNVRHWLHEYGIPIEDDLVSEILDYAKKHYRLLTVKEIDEVIYKYRNKIVGQ
ncbi:MAG: LeuA family protein [Mariprofundus sp.]